MPTTETLPSWLDVQAINHALNSVSAPSASELTDILDKSLELIPLSIQEAASLMKISDAQSSQRLLDTAGKVKQRVYGDRIVLSAPLHISNHCSSECLYCANRMSNTLVERRYMTSPEIREAGKKLIRQGHKRIFLVSGQLPNTAEVEYLAEAAGILCTLFDTETAGEIRRVNVNVGPLDKEEYRLLLDSDVGTVLIYQDTYHEQSYRGAHVRGPKSDYAGRLAAPFTALSAGAKDVGMGILLGLGPWQYDVLALMLHSAFLARAFGMGGHNVSMHRMRPVPGGGMAAPFPLSDAEYLRCVAIVRLAMPHTGIVLTTREPAGLWREACNAGCSQLLTGSVANPYENWNHNAEPGGVPFPVSEDCHVDETVRFLLEDARHLPSFCTACPRLGRSGMDFFSMVQECGMKSQCDPNSIASFMEFLLNFATPPTRERGEKLLAEKLALLPESERGAAERLLQKVRSGRSDEFI